MRYCLLLGLLALLTVGCRDAATTKLGGSTSDILQWPALDTLENDTLLGIGYAADRKDWAGVKKQVQSPEFKAAVTEFEQAELPSGFGGRAEQKAQVVQKLKDLTAAAESNAPNDQLKAAHDQLRAAINALRTGKSA